MSDKAKPRLRQISSLNAAAQFNQDEINEWGKTSPSVVLTRNLFSHEMSPFSTAQFLLGVPANNLLLFGAGDLAIWSFRLPPKMRLYGMAIYMHFQGSAVGNKVTVRLSQYRHFDVANMDPVLCSCVSLGLPHSAGYLLARGVIGSDNEWYFVSGLTPENLHFPYGGDKSLASAVSSAATIYSRATADYAGSLHSDLDFVLAVQSDATSVHELHAGGIIYACSMQEGVES